MTDNPVTFRLGPETLYKLDTLCKEWNTSRTGAVKNSIGESYQRITENADCNTACNTECNTESGVCNTACNTEIPTVKSVSDNTTDDQITDGESVSVVTIPANVLETLQGQLAIKDDQIASLNQALLKAQDSNTELTKSLQAAQTLNAMDKPQTKQAVLEQSNETVSTANQPIGNMTFRQVWRLWRKQRKE